jgi:hypothetical protein
MDGIAFWMRLWLERIAGFAKTPPEVMLCTIQRARTPQVLVCNEIFKPYNYEKYDTAVSMPHRLE